MRDSASGQMPFAAEHETPPPRQAAAAVSPRRDRDPVLADADDRYPFGALWRPASCYT